MLKKFAKVRRVLVMANVLAMLNLNIVFANESVAKEPDVNALSAILVDADTGRVLWGKDENEPLPMASTTKIMTAIVVIENCNLNEEVVVSKNAIKAPQVKMNLEAGEVISVEQLLYALLMQSSNDAAVALAEYVSGDVDKFCQLMTDRARDIGCRDTIFETPNGLDKGEHHSTAADLAIIGAYAIKNKEFMRISNTNNITYKTNKKTYNITNKNQLLSSYDGGIGIKTGFTGKAGHCFVGAAKRGDITFISVVLASGWGSAGKTRKWTDTNKILNYGFDNYKKYSIMGENTNINVANAKVDKVTLEYEAPIELLLTEEEKKLVRFEANLPTYIEAPVRTGQAIGEGTVYIGDSIVANLDLVATEDIQRHCLSYSYEKIIGQWFRVLC